MITTLSGHFDESGNLVEIVTAVRGYGSSYKVGDIYRIVTKAEMEETNKELTRLLEEAKNFCESWRLEQAAKNFRKRVNEWEERFENAVDIAVDNGYVVAQMVLTNYDLEEEI